MSVTAREGRVRPWTPALMWDHGYRMARKQTAQFWGVVSGFAIECKHINMKTKITRDENFIMIQHNWGQKLREHGEEHRSQSRGVNHNKEGWTWSRQMEGIAMSWTLGPPQLHNFVMRNLDDVELYICMVTQDAPSDFWHRQTAISQNPLSY